MGNMELFLISIGLAMDAFAVAVCKGLSMKKIQIKKAIIVGLWFGLFQAIMPAIGCFLGSTFKTFIDSVDNLIAFILLSFIGINMLREALKKEPEAANDDISFKNMFVLAVATSIDALTVGVTFAFFDINILFAALMIGIITFILSVLGVVIGNKFGDKYEKKAQITGGVILLSLGLENLLEHLNAI